MAEQRADPFQERARAEGPLPPGSFRAVSSDHPDERHDFPDLQSAQRYADDVASEGDYEDIPPTAYIYDSEFRQVGEGSHYGLHATPPRAAVMAFRADLAARLRRLFGPR